MKFTVDYFIEKFTAIPEKNILEREYGGPGKGCAMGLCNDGSGSHNALLELGYYLGKTKDVSTFITVNNGDHPNYQQPTPKQRILAALHDIKRMQQPEYADITKELAILPVQETSDQPIKQLV